MLKISRRSTGLVARDGDAGSFALLADGRAIERAPALRMDSRTLRDEEQRHRQGKDAPRPAGESDALLCAENMAPSIPHAANLAGASVVQHATKSPITMIYLECDF